MMMASARTVSLFLLLLPCLSLAQNSIGCYVPGECTGGQIVGNYPESSSAGCLEECKGNDRCNYFTFFSGNGICSLFETCPLSDNACHDCVSGDRTCSFQCDVIGFCDGQSVAIDVAVDKDDCMIKCKNNEFCQWWSFDAFDGFCTLLNTCTSLDITCETCLSGQKQCRIPGTESTTPEPVTEPPGPNENILFIVGGFGGGYHTEAIDLRGEGRVCEVLGMYPIFVSDATAVLSGGYPVVCGDLSPTDLCMAYSPAEEGWVPFYDNLTEPRSHGISVQLNEEDFLVLGGGEVHEFTGDLYTSSVGSFSSPIELPVNLTNACSGTINDTHFFVSGGYKDIETTSDLWIYDIPAKTWKQMRSMETPRHFHGCGTVQTDSGVEILVAGGYPSIATSEIYSLAIDSWRPGPELPEGNRGMASVQYKDSVLLVGGLSLIQRHRIMEYRPETETWFARPEEVDRPRYSHSAVMVSDDIVTCTVP